MPSFDTEAYLSYFKKELADNLLSFWMPRCLDAENGGYLNCFCNDGSQLVSTDKYTWSQGRFLWMFSKLAMSHTDLFDDAARTNFLQYAKSGRDFLRKHVLIAEDDLRCVFLMHADGTPKYVEGYTELDMSIFADCFVTMGFAAYAAATGDRDAFDFAKALGDSVWERYQSGNYRTLPYPLSPRYVAHSKPMILTNVCCELYKAAEKFDPAEAQKQKKRIAKCHREVFEIFADEKDLVHEFKEANGDFSPDLFGQHINPGHVIEDMWFQLEAADILGDFCNVERICAIAKRTLETGWDETYGGLYHFVKTSGEEGWTVTLGMPPTSRR